MKNTFKRAHEIAREIKAEYPEVDYRTQFGICLSYLLNNKEEAEMTEEQAIKNLKEKLEEEYETSEESRRKGYWSLVNCNLWEKYGKRRLYVEVWEGRKNGYKEWKRKNNIAVIDLESKRIIECDYNKDLVKEFVANL